MCVPGEMKVNEETMIIARHFLKAVQLETFISVVHKRLRSYALPWVSWVVGAIPVEDERVALARSARREGACSCGGY